MLRINSKNILGWLKLLVDIYPLEPDEKFILLNYINRKDQSRLAKEIEEVFDDRYS